ncbi:hypothetical protein EDD15DRAFT_2158798, partial [Pisolithus albus]
FRSQWFVEGLSPSTNYTAYAIQDRVKVSGPIYFLTKSCTSRFTSIHFFNTWPTSRRCSVLTFGCGHDLYSPLQTC